MDGISAATSQTISSCPLLGCIVTLKLESCAPTLSQAAKMHVKMTAIVKMVKMLKIRCFWVFMLSLAFCIAGIFNNLVKI